MTFPRSPIAAAVLAAGFLSAPASAQEVFGFDLKGSLGQGRFQNYVPPVSMFTLNETPFITTEVRPIFIYHRIPSGFVTDGGRVIGGAVQARLALGDRFGLIATTDGFVDLNFDEVLPDTDGFLDLTAGAKYAVVSDPENGNIVTVGARYTAPVGNVETAGIDLTGSTSGFLDGFVTAAKIFEDGSQAQGTFGYQWGISDRSWSYFHLHGQLTKEFFPGVFPLIEANAILPTNGGDRIPGASLTGADVFDIGASDPDPTFTLAIGARFLPLPSVSLGAVVEGNVLDIGSESANSVTGWRITADAVIHF
ncbi:MAG: hypothetical protein ACFBSD_09325 [Paracoccaceae bacterium]